MSKKGNKSIKPRRQVVMVIVEGQSDENALYVSLTEAFEAKYGEDVNVLFARIKNENDTEGGDITSRSGACPDKLHMLMNKLIVMPCLDDYSLMPKYITEIVHIIDVDGVYIDDTQVLQVDADTPLLHPIYEDASILANDPDKIRERNARKRDNIDALLAFQKDGFSIQNFVDTGHGNKPTTKPHTVPYALYYFSCNLDHFTVNDRNLDRYTKVYRADIFARQYGNSVDDFVGFLKNDTAAIKDLSYEDSWAMLKRGNNSLGRYTNISLLLKSLLGDDIFNYTERAAG